MSAAADAEALARALGAALTARGLWLATAESCTGGGIAATCTRVPGASGWLQAGLVTYTLDAKQRLLGVAADSLDRHGAVSEPVARAMAEGALAASGADLALSTTGVAGPGGGDPLVPVGTVWFGWALRGGDGIRTETGVWRLDGDREAVRAAAVVRALEGALAVLGVADPPPADD